MKIVVVGSGYVGLVTGACFANMGNEVICVDKDKNKITSLKKGKIHFYEPGLQELVVRNQRAGRLSFETNLARALRLAEIIFIAVSTPPKENGEADVGAVVAVAAEITQFFKMQPQQTKKFRVIVNKSTVPVGMGDLVTDQLLAKGVPSSCFTVVSNPEFLREGSAIADFMRPDRIVIGASSNRAFNVITELYRFLNAHIIFTSVKSAELIKYAANAFLATKISFINEMARLCEKVGSDVNEVAFAIGADRRIGQEFLNAGVGFGGSCFPKDLAALEHLARTNSCPLQIVAAAREANQKQCDFFISKIISYFHGNLKGKTLAMLGLSFKPNTDDLREAPALKVLRKLKAKGAKIKIYDPALVGQQIEGTRVLKNSYSIFERADAMVLTTEWGEFLELDFDRIKKSMRAPVIFDGRNLYDPAKMREMGFSYFGIGRADK